MRPTVDVLTRADRRDRARTRWTRSPTRRSTAFGRVDVWVHTAAVMAYGRFDETAGRVFDQVVRTDLLGAAGVAAGGAAALPGHRRPAR